MRAEGLPGSERYGSPLVGPNKATNGEDSIYWDKSKNRYVGAVSLGFTATGRRKRAKVSGKTKTEVRSKLRDKKKELEAGVKASATYTIEKGVEDWLAQGIKGRDENSITMYRSLAENHIIADLGKAKLKDLSADALDCWLEEKSAILATSSLQMGLYPAPVHHTCAASRQGVAKRGGASGGARGPARPTEQVTLARTRKVSAVYAGRHVDSRVRSRITARRHSHRGGAPTHVGAGSSQSASRRGSTHRSMAIRAQESGDQDVIESTNVGDAAAIGPGSSGAPHRSATPARDTRPRLE